jgi:hypothetical protein
MLSSRNHFNVIILNHTPKEYTHARLQLVHDICDRQFGGKISFGVIA